MPHPGRARRDRDGGFTLIELLVVLLVVGILSAIAIPSYLDHRRRAIDSSIKTDARTVATHLEAFWAERGTYPRALATPPDVSFAGAVLTLGTESVHLSPDNTPQIWVNGPNGACVQVLNPQSTDPAHGYVWRLDSGGLQPRGADCAGYGTQLL